MANSDKDSYTLQGALSSRVSFGCSGPQFFARTPQWGLRACLACIRACNLVQSFYPSLSILNIKYLVSIFDRGKWDNLDNCRLLSPTWNQRKIMRHLIQNAAKKKVMKGGEISNNVGLWRRIELFKKLLPFLRKIQVSVRRAIYLAFCRVFDLLVLIEEIK